MQGVDATTVTIEVNEFRGINFHLGGFPDNAVKENQQRIYSALRSNNLEIPGKKIVTDFG